MSVSQVIFMVIAGTIGAWAGMMLSRYLKRRREAQKDKSGTDSSQE